MKEVYEINMNKDLDNAYKSLKKEVKRLEETGTKKLISNTTYKEMKMAVTIAELTGGFCPDCQKEPIHPNLLAALYFPFCMACASNFGQKPKKRRKFIEKKIKKLQETKI